MASELVKLHRGEDIKPRAMNKWNLAQGSLVYTHENRRLMGARFRKASTYRSTIIHSVLLTRLSSLWRGENMRVKPKGLAR